MKTCKLCKCEKPLIEFYRKGKSPRCISCEKERYRQYCEKNKEVITAKADMRNKNNKEKYAQNRKKFWESNKDRLRVERKENYETNKEAVLKKRREYAAKNKDLIKAIAARTKKKNAANINALNSKRRADKLRATPIWADMNEVKNIYKKAKQLGPEYHVDHIVPLISPLVSGLHCEANLQILTAEENLKKNNRYWPDMPD